jgi:outer membrane immunogenic protein
MKKLLLIGAAFAVLLAPAMAAEKPVRVHKRPRPVVVAAPVYTWTGFYVGGNVGGSWGNARTDIAGSGTFFTFPSAGSLPGNQSSVAFADSNTARLNGVIGGGQIGYNYQFSPNWVLGFETDIQASGERGSSSFLDPVSTSVCTQVTSIPPPTHCAVSFPLNGAVATSYEAKIDWFGTVRNRLGYLVADRLLLYATGGLAYGRVEISGNSTVNGFVGAVPLTRPGTTGFSVSSTNVGFVVGGGIEGKFSYWLPANWTWKLEYLYMDLGSLNTASPFPPAVATAVSTPFTGAIATHTHFTDNIVRVGLNYKFGYAAAPAVYK